MPGPVRLAAVAVAALAACGHGASPPPVATAVVHPAPPSVQARPAGPDDLVVARVDGRPIYGSGVQAQAAAFHLDAHPALDQCIGFELLAGAADARGLRGDPHVADTLRREMVRGLIER